MRQAPPPPGPSTSLLRATCNRLLSLEWAGHTDAVGHLDDETENCPGGRRSSLLFALWYFNLSSPLLEHTALNWREIDTFSFF